MVVDAGNDNIAGWSVYQLLVGSLPDESGCHRTHLWVGSPHIVCGKGLTLQQLWPQLFDYASLQMCVSCNPV